MGTGVTPTFHEAHVPREHVDLGVVEPAERGAERHDRAKKRGRVVVVLAGVVVE